MTVRSRIVQIGQTQESWETLASAWYTVQRHEWHEFVADYIRFR